MQKSNMYPPGYFFSPDRVITAFPDFTPWLSREVPDDAPWHYFFFPDFIPWLSREASSPNPATIYIYFLQIWSPGYHENFPRASRYIIFGPDSWSRPQGFLVHFVCMYWADFQLPIWTVFYMWQPSNRKYMCYPQHFFIQTSYWNQNVRTTASTDDMR